MFKKVQVGEHFFGLVFVLPHISGVPVFTLTSNAMLFFPDASIKMAVEMVDLSCKF